MLRTVIVLCAILCFRLFAQDPREFAKTCVIVLDAHGGVIKAPEITAFAFSSKLVSQSPKSKCFTGPPGTAFAVGISARGFYPAHVIIEIGWTDTERFIHLRPGLREATTAEISGRVDCAGESCLIKAQQVDGEQIYTVEASNRKTFSLRRLRPGQYVITLVKSGRITCIRSFTVSQFGGDKLTLDFADCGTATAERD